MINIAICDDEASILTVFQKQIHDIIVNQGLEAQYFLYDNCENLLKDYDRIQCDFLFLDIDMPGMSGFELAKCITEKEKKAILVFVTNQDALVYESFTFHPFSFIRKAFFTQEIDDVMTRMIEEYRKVLEYYSFRIGSDVYKTTIQSMMYFEADGNYVKLVTTEGEYRIRETLTNLSSTLENAGFIRIHKGFLVNQIFIVAIKQNEVELIDKSLLPIGRTNRDTIRKQLMRYLR